ncbi:MAG: PD40 domain-containing protein [Thermoleophilia bacterium]|nr:PD40 domain-containing protein [Thermoleophilia bacterium]
MPTDLEIARLRRASRGLFLAALGLAAAALVLAAGVLWRLPVLAGAAVPTPAELAFERGREIYVARSDGTGLRNLTRSPAHEYAPAWSPDGAQLMFVGYRHGNAELYAMRADGTGLRRLTRHRAEELTPSWSPDGRRIAFTSDRSGAFDIYVANADGSGVLRVTRLGRPNQGSFGPAWSPAGDRIVFSSAGPTPENPELYSIRPDGTGLRRLTRTAGGVEVLGDDGMPDWSPDGRTIVFTSNRSGGGALWTMRADGRGQRVLLDLPRSDEFHPRYSPDGRLIAFTRLSADGRVEIWVVRADGRGARRVGPGSEPSWRRG